jgi:uncharacterized membrane protein YqiK
MIDSAQAVLLLVVVVLTVLLVVLGVQVFFILRELRKTIAKANKVLEDTGNITESVSGPISSLSTLANGLKTGVSIARLLKGKSKLIKRLTQDDE